MTDKISQPRISEAKNDVRLLLCLLLLELALLFFQHVISRAIRKESITLGRIYESHAAYQNEYSNQLERLKSYEAEEIKLEQKLPNLIDSAEQALIQTRERLNALKIAGEVREKTRSGRIVILETVCEGTYADLAALLDCLREGDYAIRLSRLTVNALDNERLGFTAEIEYAYPGSYNRTDMRVSK